MGLKFLNKQQWHPGTFGNIEKVWLAEQKQKESERKTLENMKKLKEERQIEELKKLQVTAGLIPESRLQRLDWMYQGPDASSDITTAEEYLLGKPIKDNKPEEKKHFTPVFQESYSNPQNEIFTKMHEDPLFSIKKEEHSKRKEIENNPYKMKLLLKEVEKNIKKRKKEEKKEKKHKKHKRKHHRKHSSSSSSSRSSTLKEVSKDRYKTPDLEKLRISTPALLKNLNPSNNSFGLIDKNGNKVQTAATANRRISDIRPDETLYKERIKMMEKESELRKRKHVDTSLNVKELSKEEKEKRVAEMEKKAYILEYQRNLQIEEKNLKNKHESDKHRGSSNIDKPKFIKSIESDTYTEGKNIS